MKRVALLILSVALPGARAWAGDEPPSGPVAPSPAVVKPRTPEQAADAVVAALAAKDDAALKALASKDAPDPWLVADELIRRGGFDAAEAFARAAPRVDTEALPAYVATRRSTPEDPARRERLAKANAALGARRPADALEALGSPASETIDDVLGVRLAMVRGVVLRDLVRLEASAAAFLAAGDAAERMGWWARAATALYESGMTAYRGSAFAAARTAWERGLSTCERRGDKGGVAGTLGNLGLLHAALGDYAKALAAHEQALAAKEALGDRAGVATVLGNIGNVHYHLGEFPQALATHQRALASQEALGDRAGVARTLGNIGNVHAALGDYARALATHEQALAVKESLGDREGVAATLCNLGIAHRGLGDLSLALAAYERALAMQEALGDKAGAARTLANIGNIHSDRGDYAKALVLRERALAAQEAVGDKAGAARTLCNVGLVHSHLGNYAKALSILERALEAQESGKDRLGAATTLGNVGKAYSDLGDHAKALSIHERALEAQESLGDRAGVAATLGNIGNAQLDLGDPVQALATFERALAAQEALKDQVGAARTLGNIGNVYGSLGDPAKSLSIQERALAAKEALGDKAGAALTLGNTSRLYLRLGDYGKATESARRAVSLLETTTRGLSAEEGAGARAPRSGIYDVGMAASMALKDVSETTFFLESGRAGALLEGLAARDALLEFAVPEDLRRAEATARAKEAVATRALRQALDTGDVATEAARRAEFEAASEQVAAVVARIQREAKAGAAILYPVTATLDEIRATLAPGDVLVSYALLEKDAAALVVTKENARIVPLGLRAPIDAAATAATRALPSDGSDTVPVLSTLAALVVKPLGLPPGTKRVLVSPAGVLAYVPFTLLVPDVPVAYVPSGTTYRLLRADEALRGDGVLALGDPDYGTKADPFSISVHRGGAGSLAPLPASREEAKAVGTVTLLGADATEARLRSAVADRKRWRSVHLACHGLVNTERPALSSLAVTVSGDDDGFLSCLDVFGMKVPADLVVLSACETGKGNMVKGEGLVGLTRAFMFAGSPRVLCSLWKVDDAATQFLMTRFYELWNPKEGVGLPASEALRRAQASVREHEVELEDPASVATGQVRLVKVKPWAHPTFWAAWVLWGLPS